ncbi:MAG: FHIPEP family type III secretion protein [Acetatifactor sp.]
MTTLGERISYYRKNVNITQEELAYRLGVTSQAISKWERNQSYPDIGTFAELCRALRISADVLLETECGNLSEKNDTTIHEEIRKILRGSEEPFVLEFGTDVVKVFLEGSFVEQIGAVRKELARMGILMPVVHIRDNNELKETEFMILSYHRVLYKEVLEVVDEKTLDTIVSRLKEVVTKQYGYILNEDIVKTIVDNLRVEYPALIANVIPEIISYSTLRKVMAGLIERGDGLCYMIKTIEVLEERMRENPKEDISALIEAVANEIEREDNYWVMRKLQESSHL